MEVWKAADELAASVYRASKTFPKEERFGLTAQLRRAALSVPTNIVEGYSRRGDRTLRHFLDVSLGSLAEVKYLLHFAAKLEFLAQGEYTRIAGEYSRLGQRLWRFYESVDSSL